MPNDNNLRYDDACTISMDLFAGKMLDISDLDMGFKKISGISDIKIAAPIKKLKRRFGKDLKFEIFKYKTTKKVDDNTRFRIINFYKKLIKNDKTLSNDKKAEFNNLIVENRLALAMNNSVPKLGLKISYRGLSKLVYSNHHGFFPKRLVMTALSDIIQDIKFRRYKTRTNKSRQLKTVAGMQTLLVGGTYENPGSILQLYQQIGRRRVNSLHLPKSEEKHVGVEIEFFSAYSRDQLTEILISNKLSNFCRIMTDGSIRPSYEKPYGYELCVLFPEKDAEKIIEQVCLFFMQINAEVNESCGLHVHLDMRNRNVKTVFNNFVRCQGLLFSLVTPSRAANRYCMPQLTTDFDQADGSNHYYAISKSAYNKYKTLEIRLHQGSVDFQTISNWVKLLTKIANYDKTIEDIIDTPDQLGKIVSVEESNLSFYKNMWKMFKGA